MAGVAQGFFEALADAALESLRQGRSSSRSMKRDQGREAVHMKFFRLGKRLDGEQFSFTQDAGRLHVFVYESLDREHELVEKRGDRPSRKAANIELERVGASAEPVYQFSAEDRRHAGRQPAIRRDCDPALFGFRRQRKLLANASIF